MYLEQTFAERSQKVKSTTVVAITITTITTTITPYKSVKSGIL